MDYGNFVIINGKPMYLYMGNDLYYDPNYNELIIVIILIAIFILYIKLRVIE